MKSSLATRPSFEDRQGLGKPQCWSLLWRIRYGSSLIGVLQPTQLSFLCVWLYGRRAPPSRDSPTGRLETRLKTPMCRFKVLDRWSKPSRTWAAMKLVLVTISLREWLSNASNTTDLCKSLIRLKHIPSYAQYGALFPIPALMFRGTFLLISLCVRLMWNNVIIIQETFIGHSTVDL